MKKLICILLGAFLFWGIASAQNPWEIDQFGNIKQGYGTLGIVNLVVKSPYVNVHAYMDGQLGRPTYAQWVTNQEMTDVTTVEQAAINAAGINGIVFFPAGTYLGEFYFHGGTGTPGGQYTGITIKGAGKSRTILKGKATTTRVIDIEPAAHDGSFVNNNKIEDLTIDMFLMPNAATSYGLYMQHTWGNEINIDVINRPPSAFSVYLSHAVYTSTFKNMSFDNLNIQGIASNDAVTTCIFINCSINQVTINYGNYTTFLNLTMQGAYNPRFSIANSTGLTILGGDIEGGAQTYLAFGADVTRVTSMGNAVDYSVAYYTGTPTRYLFGDVGSLTAIPFFQTDLTFDLHGATNIGGPPNYGGYAGNIYFGYDSSGAELTGIARTTGTSTDGGIQFVSRIGMTFHNTLTLSTGKATFLLGDVPEYASNALARTGGLTDGDVYRDGGDPDHLCIVHPVL